MGTEWDETEKSISKYKKTLSPQLGSLFVYLGKIIRIDKYWLGPNDALQSMLSQKLQVKDELQMFEEHVNF